VVFTNNNSRVNNCGKRLLLEELTPMLRNDPDAKVIRSLPTTEESAALATWLQYVGVPLFLCIASGMLAFLACAFALGSIPSAAGRFMVYVSVVGMFQSLTVGIPSPAMGLTMRVTSAKKKGTALVADSASLGHPIHVSLVQGAPTPVTSFMGTAPKVAAMALLVRLMVTPFGHLLAQWQQLIVLVAVVVGFVAISILMAVMKVTTGLGMK